ncbi:MAG TPA: DUF1080 domain-containing protein [Verrucomicrobiae bacterium]|nr:DUF1080 domain-containing protein [Verrucomicrobiae bacterium]
MVDLEGQTFAGFEIISKLGQGGMGAVYKARQSLLDRLAALKVMAYQLVSEPGFVVRFQREATAAANLSHPNLVQVYMAGECEGTHYIAMEFVEGESLGDRLKRHGKLDPREAIAVTVYVAQALQYAWNTARLIHRDIKPDNIFLSAKGEVKVGDLGLSKSLGGSTMELTRTGMMVGTPDYISPEQARGVKDIDFRSDIYSLGCTLYRMLTGRPPYDGGDAMGVMMRHVHDPPPAIFKVWPQCPVPLGLLVGKMLAKDRTARHSSYEELISDLLFVHDKLRAEQAQAPPISPCPPIPSSPHAYTPRVATPRIPKAPTTARRRPVPLPAIIGGTTALVALAGILLWAPWKQGPAAVTPRPVAETADAGFHPLFNGTDLTGWMVRDPRRRDAWLIRDGELINPGKSTDLISEESFGDFELRLEFKLPPDGNSGVFLRGLYEIQLADDAGRPPTPLISGGVWSQTAPAVNAAGSPDAWQTLDCTLVGNAATVVLNGQKVLDAAELRGPTKGGLDADPGKSGPVVLQGRISGVAFRNIRIKPLGATSPTAVAWIPLDISDACSADVISTAFRPAADPFTFNGGTLATTSWLRKNGFPQPGLPDDGSVQIPGTAPPGSFRVKMPPGRNAALLSGPQGPFPQPVTVELTADERRRYAEVAILHVTCWGDGTLRALLHYETGADSTVSIPLCDWFPGARTVSPAGLQVAVASHDTHPTGGKPMEMFAQRVPTDPRRKLCSLTFSIGSLRPPKGYSDRDARSRFTTGIFAISARPAAKSWKQVSGANVPSNAEESGQALRVQR